MRRMPGRDSGFLDDLELADVADPVDVRAAAEFDREVTETQHAHAIAVFFAEQGGGAGLQRVVEIHDLDVGGGIHADFAIDQPLDLGQLLRAHRTRMGEIETQMVGSDQRTALLDVVTQHLLQGGVHQVRGRVVQHDGLAARPRRPGR